MKDTSSRRRAEENAALQGSERRDAMSAEKILLFAREEEKHGESGKAEELYQLALAADSEHADTLASYGAFLQNVCQDYDSAERIYKKGLSLHPHHLDTLQNYAIFLEEVKGDLEEAERLYNVAFDSLAMERTPSPAADRNRPQSQTASAAALPSSSDADKVFSEDLSRGSTLAQLPTDRGPGSRVTVPKLKLTDRPEAKSASEGRRPVDTMSQYPTKMPAYRKPTIPNVDVLKASKPKSADKGINMQPTEEGSSKKASLALGARRVDAERRFIDGSFTLTGEEKVNGRHNIAHTGKMHSKPWMGPLDNPRRIPRRKSMDPHKTSTWSRSHNEGHAAARSPPGTIEAVPVPAAAAANAADENAFVPLRQLPAASPPSYSKRGDNDNLQGSRAPAPGRGGEAATRSPVDNQKDPNARSPETASLLNRYDPELRLALRKVFRGIDQVRASGAEVTGALVRSVFNTHQLDVAAPDAARLTQHFQNLDDAPARRIAPADFLQATWQTSLKPLSPSPEQRLQAAGGRAGVDAAPGASHPLPGGVGARRRGSASFADPSMPLYVPYSLSAAARPAGGSPPRDSVQGHAPLHKFQSPPRSVPRPEAYPETVAAMPLDGVPGKGVSVPPLTPPRQGQPAPRLQIPSHRAGPEVSAAQWLQQVKQLRQRQGPPGAWRPPTTSPSPPPIPPGSHPQMHAWFEVQPPKHAAWGALTADQPPASAVQPDQSDPLPEAAASWAARPGPALTVSQLHTWGGAGGVAAGRDPFAALARRDEEARAHPQHATQGVVSARPEPAAVSPGREDVAGGTSPSPSRRVAAHRSTVAAGTGDLLASEPSSRSAYPAEREDALRRLAAGGERAGGVRGFETGARAGHASGEAEREGPGSAVVDGSTRTSEPSPAPTRWSSWRAGADPLEVEQLHSLPSQADPDPSTKPPPALRRSVASSQRAPPATSAAALGSSSRRRESGRSRSAGPRLGTRVSSGREEDEQVTGKFSMLKPQRSPERAWVEPSERVSAAVVVRRDQGAARQPQRGGRRATASETGDESEDDFGQARLRRRAAERTARQRRGSTGTAAEVGRASLGESPPMDGYTRRACVAFVDALQQLFLTPSTAFGFFCAHRTDVPPSDPFSSKRGPRLSSLPASMVTRSDFVDTLPLLGVTLSPGEANAVFDSVSDRRLGLMTYSSLHSALRSFKFIAGPDFAATAPVEQRPCKAIRERKLGLQRFGAAMWSVWSHPAEAFVFMDPECSDTLSKKNLLQGLKRLHVADVTAEQVLQELAAGGVEGVVTVRDFMRHFAPKWQPPRDAAQALRDYGWIKSQGRIDAQARYSEWAARQRGQAVRASKSAQSGSSPDEALFGTGNFKLPLSASVRSTTPTRSSTPDGAQSRRVGSPRAEVTAALSADRSVAEAISEGAQGRGAKKRGLAGVMDIFSMIEASPVAGTPSLLARSPDRSHRRLAEEAAEQWEGRELASRGGRWMHDDEEALEDAHEREVLRHRQRDAWLAADRQREQLRATGSPPADPRHVSAHGGTQNGAESSPARDRSGSGGARSPARSTRDMDRQPTTRRSLSAELDQEVDVGARRGGERGREGGLLSRAGPAEAEDNASSVLERSASSGSSPSCDGARKRAVQRVREKREKEAALLRRIEEERRARKTMKLHEKAEHRKVEEESRKARRKHIKYPDPGDPSSMTLRLFRRHSSAPRARPSSRRSSRSRASSRSRSRSASPERTRERSMQSLPSGGLKRSSSTGKQRSVRWERSVEEREEWLRRSRGGLGGNRGMAHQSYYSYG